MVYIIAETSIKSKRMKNMEKQAGELFVFPCEFFTNAINIVGSIDDTWADKVVRELDFLAQHHKTIIVSIESPGGDFFAAKRILDKLLSISEDVKTIGIATGDLSSIAAMVFQGFSLRIISNKTEMLVHNLKEDIHLCFIPFVHSQKKALKVVGGMINEAYSAQQVIRTTLSAFSGKPESFFKKLLLEKPVLGANKILEYGLADQILDSEQISEFRQREEKCM